ncbi:MAG: type I methionyl aminopeptidase [Flavobacteriales bacterium]|nr:type I methionyl aminopeptidase [Flavobacteriales bacterium]|tara:strand:- start:9996 stop:10793 length:798 start_codon:yes stop_codon:yes gene_type:complete
MGREIYKTKEEIELIRESSLLVAKTHGAIAGLIKPGVTTLELDKIAEEFIRDHDAIPAFKGYAGFPNTLCMSPNEEVVHGIPQDKPLKDGDIISVDCGVLKNEFYGDSAYTYTVGEVAEETKQLLRVTKDCLYLGIEAAKIGNRLGDISYAIQQKAHEFNYGVVRELVGHGVGRELHEEPQVPNYGSRGRGIQLKEGLVLAIEPMINMGTQKVRFLNDGWSVITQDGKPSAHFEHTVAIMKSGPEVLSSFAFIEEELKKNKIEIL